MKDILKELDCYIVDGYINKEKLLQKLDSSYCLMEINSFNEINKALYHNVSGITKLFWVQLKKTRTVTVSCKVPIVLGSKRTKNVFIHFYNLQYINKRFVCDKIDYEFKKRPMVTSKSIYNQGCNDTKKD